MSASGAVYVCGEPLLHQGREVLPGQEVRGLDPDAARRLQDEGRISTDRPDTEPTGGGSDPPADPPGDEAPDLSKLKKGELEKLASDRRVEVTGTGKDGAVTVKDLVAALESQPRSDPQ